MQHYIIDGNNLIGKIKFLHALQRKDKQGSREGLVDIINNYFAGKKIVLTLHLDGHSNTPLHLSKGKIKYSEKQTSDYYIRNEITEVKNPKLITLVSSDHSLMNFARACSCQVIKSEDFYKMVEQSSEKNEESEKLKQLDRDKSVFLKLFEER